MEPSSGLGSTEGRTHYLGAQGNQNMFDGTKDGISLRQITDGLSNTIAILQVNNVRAAIWTQPDDWELDKDDPLKGVKNSPHPAGFLARYADGSIHFMAEDMDTEAFQSLLTRNGGEVVNVD